MALRLENRIAAIERRVRIDHPGVDPHPLPDLTGANPEQVASAIAAAISAANRPDDPFVMCPACTATVREAAAVLDDRALIDLINKLDGVLDSEDPS